MGNGDFKLLAALGAWLGVGILPVSDLHGCLSRAGGRTHRPRR